MAGQGERPSVLRMRLAGGAAYPVTTGEGELDGKTNYLLGNDPTLWTTGVPSYRRVRCAEVYLGIDVVYHGAAGVLEYDFVVGPEADPSRIALEFEAADSVTVDGRGDLVPATPAGTSAGRVPASTTRSREFATRSRGAARSGAGWSREQSIVATRSPTGAPVGHRTSGANGPIRREECDADDWLG